MSMSDNKTSTTMTDEAAGPSQNVRDTVTFEWSPKCLELPVVPLDATITFASADQIAAAYDAAVGQAVADWTAEDKTAVVQSMLTLFVADNFTGELNAAEVDMLRPLFDHFVGFASKVPPPVEPIVGRAAKEAFDAKCAELAAQVATREKKLRTLLTQDGEAASVCVSRPGLILAARGVALTLPKTNIWRLRTLYRHLLCLQRHAHSLFVLISESVDALRDTTDPLTLLELALVQSEFHQEELAATSAYKAATETGLLMEETAMVGIRTRWQVQQHAQSLLVAESKLAPDTLSEVERGFSSPTVVESEKDGHDLFDRPRVSADAEALSEKPLAHIDHAIIMALGRNIGNNNAKLGLTTHQIQVYIERLIVDKAATIYCLRAMALLIRARVEQHRNRVAQRSFLQMQEFLDSFYSARDPDQPHLYRALSKYVWALDYPSKWAFKREFAAECYGLNMFKTALSYYEDVEDWDNIIRCCTALDKRRKAEVKARDMIEHDPENPILWVALGEATREEAHLWKAWELCGKKMAAPMRSLAKLALEREQWDKVVEYFDLAVAINPVFGGDWFSLGFALMKQGELVRAAAAFTRVCQMEADNSYAWTNLGNIYMKIGKYHAAFSALSQALRHNRSNWRMWGNYFTVAVHLKEVKEATHALHTAVGLAERSFVFEDQALIDFTTIALQYLKGEIENSGNVQSDEELDFKPVPTVVEDEETEIEPLFEAIAREHADEGPSAADLNAADTRKKQIESAARAAREAYRKRMRKVFESLQSYFVTNPEVFACCARLYGYLDGVETEFKYRLKEVREAESQHWERTETQFKRVVQALSSLVFAAEQICTADAKRQALEAVDRAITCGAEHMEQLPIFRDVQKLRVRASKINVVATAAAAAATPAAPSP